MQSTRQPPPHTRHLPGRTLARRIIRCQRARACDFLVADDGVICESNHTSAKESSLRKQPPQEKDKRQREEEKAKLTPPLRPSLRHDIEMRRIPITIRDTTPLRISIGGTKIRNHNRNRLPLPATIALPLCSNGPHVSQFVTFPAPAAAPAGGGAVAREEVLRRGGGVELGAGG